MAERKFNFTREQAVKLCALMAQAEYGDYHRETKTLPEIISPWPKDIMEEEVANAHIGLKGTAPKTARDTFLNEMSKHELYDAEIFKAKAAGQKVVLAVCSTGVKVFERKAHGKLKQM